MCGKEMLRRPSKVFKHNFCSKECREKWTKLNKKVVYKTCLNCGKKFEVRPWEKKKFCSVECSWEYRRLKIDDKLLEELYVYKRFSSIKIAKLLGVSCEVIVKRLREKGIIRTRSDSLTRYVPITPSPELSYIIGVVLGDGSVMILKNSKSHKGKHMYRIKLTVKDRDFVEAFNRAICKILGKEKPYTIIREKNNFYRVTCTSKHLVMFFKNTSLDELLNLARKYPADFIRGLFDSDGYVDISSRGGTQTIIGITNTNEKIISFVQSLLSEMGIYSKVRVARVTSTGKKEYDLRIWRKEDVKKFRELIGSNVKRRLERMEVVK